MHQHQKATGAAKKVAPVLTGVAGRLRITKGFDFGAAFLHFLGGQGSGTGWDIGEAVTATNELRDVDSPVVIDCGANAGEWTIDVRERLGCDDGTWLLVEPADEYADQLEEMPNVDVIRAAAGEKPGDRTLYVPDEPSGWMTLHERNDTFSESKDFSPRKIEVVRLDEELEERGIDHVDYLKIDVEGHELWVLRGLGRFLEEKRVGALTFEFGAANVNSRTFFRDFWELLHPLGYEISRIAPGGTLVPIPDYYEHLEYFRGATNYLAHAA